MASRQGGGGGGGWGERKIEREEHGKRERRSRVASAALLHYVISLLSLHHFLPFLLVAVGQLLGTEHQSASNK